MSSTQNKPQSADDPMKNKSDEKPAALQGDKHCPECSPGDLICKCCGISVASEEWCEDDKMCDQCSDLQPKNKKDA